MSLLKISLIGEIVLKRKDGVLFEAERVENLSWSCRNADRHSPGRGSLLNAEKLMRKDIKRKVAEDESELCQIQGERYGDTRRA